MTSARTTGLGALPHTDPDEAARFVLATAGVPYLPELPNRHPREAAIVRWGDGLCGCGAAGVGPGLEYGAPPGAPSDEGSGPLGVADSLPAGTRRVVTFAVGPVTLAAAVRAAGHPGGAALWEGVVAGLSERLREHVRSVRDRVGGAEIVVLFDEPALSIEGADQPEALGALQSVLAAVPDPSGVRCCGEWDPALAARLRPDWLAIDTSALGPAFVDAAPEIAAAASSGTRIIWGAVPVQPPPLPSVEALVARVRRAEGVLVLAGADIRHLDEALVAPSCGMAGLTVDQAWAVAESVIEVAERLDG